MEFDSTKRQKELNILLVSRHIFRRHIRNISDEILRIDKKIISIIGEDKYQFTDDNGRERTARKKVGIKKQRVFESEYLEIK